uniref:Ovule protein n=1 Tax=Heterorhabditis bacteriophora TaxID=37862 RepID=A0A1I7WLQ0_HETBA
MLGIVTLVNFFYYVIVLLVPQLRARLVLFNVDSNKHDVKHLMYSLIIAFYPSLSSTNVQNKTFESSAPALENYMDHGTMKIGEKTPLQDQQARSSPTDV